MESKDIKRIQHLIQERDRLIKAKEVDFITITKSFELSRGIFVIEEELEKIGYPCDET